VSLLKKRRRMVGLRSLVTAVEQLVRATEHLRAAIGNMLPSNPDVPSAVARLDLAARTIEDAYALLDLRKGE